MDDNASSIFSSIIPQQGRRLSGFLDYWHRTVLLGLFRPYNHRKIRADNPIQALALEGFEGWEEGVSSAHADDFFFEKTTRFGIWKRGAFRDQRLLKAAVSKLDVLMLYGTRLGRKEMESLRAAYVPGFTSTALVLLDCNLDPDDDELKADLAQFLASHVKRLGIVRIRSPSCDWTELGRALKLPGTTLQDLYISQYRINLDWLVDALNSQHCKLRRLALERAALSKQLVQVLESQLEGLKIAAGPRYFSDEELLVLAEALKASSNLWFFQASGSSLRHLLHERLLKAQKLSHLVLSVTFEDDLTAAVSFIPELLGSPDCRLQSFIILIEDWCQELPRLAFRKLQEHGLDSLEVNYHSQLQELYLGPWQSKSLELRCSNLLYRNSLSLGKFVRDLSQPGRVLKLFMCGHTGVGKTTIAINLLRPSAIPVPAQLQRHDSTQGISLRNFETGDGKTLVVFDLAGQEVYHAFHHYFLRRSENDLFLIVCKVDKNNEGLDSEQSLEKFQRLLRYWLRFIVSHQSAHTQEKPKVFVVLNRFCKRDELEYDALKAANEIQEQFSTKVSLMQPLLEVVALKPKHLLELKARLKLLTKVTAQHLRPVPRICSELIGEKTRKWYQIGRVAAPGEKTILQLDELRSWLPTNAIEDEIKQMNYLKFAMICLHNMGEAIYFGEDGLANHVILDVQWFVHDVIGKFIPQLPRNDDYTCERAILSNNPLHQKLKKLIASHCKDRENRVAIIVKYLEEMGVIIPHWEDVQKVIIPTLLKNKFTGWQEDHGTRYRYWGRRMQPQEEEREFTLLPSGVFSIIQADIAKLCRSWHNQQSLRLGDGWISFNRNSVKVLVLVGGENEKWTDRQWVDVMLLVPEDDIRCAEAEKILFSIRDCIFNLQQACPTLKIEEHVLNPKQVKAIMHGGSNTGVQAGMQAKLLDDLIQMANAEGLDFHYAWDPENHSCVGELLMLSELKRLVQARQSMVDDFNNTIAPVYELGQIYVAVPDFADPEIRKLAEYLAGLLQRQDQQLQQLEVSMGTVLDTLHRMERDIRMNQAQILSSMSQMLRHIQVPKFPYFTDEESFFFKYSTLAGKRVWIHYMCESTVLRHHMDHNKYEGVPITIAHGWVKKYINVLIPAIAVSFFVGRVGSAFTGLPIKDVLDFVEGGLKSSLASAFHGNLKASIHSCFGGSVSITQPAEHEVEEVLDHVKNAAGEQNLTVLMAKYFGLFFHEGAWVCEKHKQRME